MDGDKLKLTKMLRKKVGLFPRKLSKCFGPVVHALVSVITGRHLIGITLHECINVLFLSFTKSQFSAHVKLGRTITRDKAYGDENAKEQILRANGNYINTQKRVKSFEYTFDRAPKGHQKVIPIKGEPCCYWCIRNPEINSRPATRIHYCGYRKTSRVEMLESSLECTAVIGVRLQLKYRASLYL